MEKISQPQGKALMLTTREVSRRLAVTRRTVTTYITQLGLPATRIGRVWRIDEAKLESWIKQREEIWRKSSSRP
jgi:excisionase family DNA binding protein